MSFIDFSELVNQHGGGSLLVNINENLQQLMDDCIETEKKGVLVLKLTFVPVPLKHGRHQVEISAQVEAKTPRFANPNAVFHVKKDAKGKAIGLSKDDPAQQEMLYGVKELKKEQ